MERAIVAEGLHINFGKNSILWDVSFEIPKGSLVGLIGPNGAGKSTLLKASLGLIKPFAGKVSIFGEVAYVPQKESIDWDFPISAKEVVLMGRYGKLGLFQRVRKADEKAAFDALEKVGMEGFADRQIGELSGGQQQRLFIARALVQQAEILLLDEPFVGVDLATEKAIMDLLKQERKRGKTICIVHHDLPSAPSYFDWVVLLKNRLIGCGPIQEVFTAEYLTKAFGKNQSIFNEAVNLNAKKASGHL